MKKGIVLLLTLSLLVLSVAGALAVEAGDTVAALKSGMEGVPFDGGFYGMCLDRQLKPAREGDKFTVQQTEGNALSNVYDENIANQIKLLFTEYFLEFFAQDPAYNYFGHSTYQYDDDGNLKLYDGSGRDGKVTLQKAIWLLTDNYEVNVNDSIRAMVNHVKEKDKEQVIPDHGFVKTFEALNYDGKTKYPITVTFDFYVLAPQQTVDGEAQQSFFMFKVTPVDASVTDSPVVTPSPKPEETESPKPEETESPKPEETESPKPEETESPKPEETETPKPENTPAPGDPGSGVNGGSPDGLPETGDETKLVLWLSLFAVAGVSLLLAFRRRHMC